jgi:hypothetical protein
VLLHKAGSDGNIVEQAESHGVGAFGVVPRRANRAEGVAAFPGEDGFGSPQDAANGKAGNLVGGRGERRVRVYPHQPMCGNTAAEEVHVLGRVDQRELLLGCRARCKVQQTLPERALLELLPNRLEAFRTFRMPRTA